ncbi:MAG TPA: delta-60 repeat domain-containing protein, partial [Pyrinomonadaceae bacterium]|nr:delta-60 repeat domain-containing protein [Pyrinomonadaceae bacterium]
MFKNILLTLIILLASQNSILGENTLSNISGGLMSNPFPPPLRDGLLDNAFAPLVSLDANGAIGRVRMQSDGKILVSGNFTVTGGQLKYGIVRLNADGSVDNTFNTTFDLGTGAGDFAILPDGKIIIVGSFTRVNGIAVNRIARLNPDGSLDGSFNVGTGANDFVSTLSLQADGKIIVAGDFTAVNGTGRTKIARLNSNGSLDTTFNTNVLAFFVNPIRQVEAQPVE